MNIKTNGTPEEAAEQKRALGVLTVIALMTGVILIYLGRRYATPLLNTLGMYFLFLGLNELLVFRILGIRAKYRELLFEPDGEQADAGDGETADGKKSRDWWKIQSSGTQVSVLVQTAAAIVLGFYAYFSLRVPAIPEAAGKEVYAFGVLCVALAFVCLVISRFLGEYGKGVFPEAAGLSHLHKLAIWLTMGGAALFILRGLGFPTFETTVHWIILIFFMLLAAEVIARAVVSAFREQQPAGEQSIYTDFLVIRFLVSGSNPLNSIAANLEEQFGVNFKSSWAIDFARRSLGPIAFMLVLLGWLWSSLEMVTIFEEGIHLRFGKPLSRETLKPGLHAVMPWPVDTVVRVPVARLNVMPIGYEQSKANASLLWTKSHAVEEYNLLVGNGRDMVTVNAELVWKIKDAYDYTFNSQNPEQILKETAYRVLLLETVGKDLDGILSENVKVFGARVEERIQRAADEKALGIEVTAFYLKGLHPPIEVARDYQAVVSSKIDKKRMQIEANAYRLQSIPIAESTSVEKVNSAKSYKYSRVSEAKGESVRFRTINYQYNVSPELYRFRNRLETLEEVLGEGRVFIIDDRFLDGEEPVQVDFRQFYKKSF